MVFFHDVFDALFRLCADSEANVQNAAQFLDNLVKVSSTCCLCHMTPEQSSHMLHLWNSLLASLPAFTARGMVLAYPHS